MLTREELNEMKETLRLAFRDVQRVVRQRAQERSEQEQKDSRMLELARPEDRPRFMRENEGARRLLDKLHAEAYRSDAHTLATTAQALLEVDRQLQRFGAPK